MGMYTPVRMVLDIVNVLTLNVLVPVLNYGPIVIILNVYSATRCSPPLFSSHYHCARGGHAAVARAVLLGAGRGRGHVRRHAPRLHGRHHGRAGAAHAQHQLDVQDGVVRVCSCARSCMRMSTISQLHMNRLLMPLYSSSTTTHARCVEQWRDMVLGDVQKQCALPWLYRG